MTADAGRPASAAQDRPKEDLSASFEALEKIGKSSVVMCYRMAVAAAAAVLGHMFSLCPAKQTALVSYGAYRRMDEPSAENMPLAMTTGNDRLWQPCG